MYHLETIIKLSLGFTLLGVVVLAAIILSSIFKK